MTPVSPAAMTLAERRGLVLVKTMAETRKLGSPKRTTWERVGPTFCTRSDQARAGQNSAIGDHAITAPASISTAAPPIGWVAGDNTGQLQFPMALPRPPEDPRKRAFSAQTPASWARSDLLFLGSGGEVVPVGAAIRAGGQPRTGFLDQSMRGTAQAKQGRKSPLKASFSFPTGSTGQLQQRHRHHDHRQ